MSDPTVQSLLDRCSALLRGGLSGDDRVIVKGAQSALTNNAGACNLAKIQALIAGVEGRNQ